jgi:hypothetical protein
MSDLASMLTGALVLACALAGLVFLRFWKSSRDPLFICFALSFWLQGGQWLASALMGERNEQAPWQYLLRLLAYGLLGFAIVHRNLRRRDPPTQG